MATSEAKTNSEEKVKVDLADEVKNNDSALMEEIDGKEKDEAKANEPEKPKELEEDDVPDTRPKGIDKIAISDTDATLDVLVGRGGSLLYGLCSEGFQHLYSSARATWGVKGGRYLFEFKIIETFGLPAAVRVGFTTDRSSLFLGDTDDSVGFNDSGDFFVGRQKTHRACPHEWAPLSVFGVLLNLVEETPNANTLSLFKDGKRFSKPMPLPDHLKGRALFPTFTFKNVTLSVEFGATTGQPQKPLPFSVRLLQDAAAADLVENTVAPPTKPEVILTVALPDSGGYDYVDQLLEARGDLVELSDRAIMKWAFKSGNKQTGQASGSNDKPHCSFGTDLDKLGVLKKLKSVAPSMHRNFVVPDVLSNLSKAGRAGALARFKGSTYRCVARVLMGKPPSDFVEAMHAKILAAKTKKRNAEVERKRQSFLKQKKLEKQRKESGKKNESAVEKEEEMMMEIDPEAEFDPNVEGSEYYVPPVAITDSDKEKMFKKALPDVTAKALESQFDKFELPDEAEGFDSIEFIWESKDASVSILNKYIINQKLNIPIDTLKPSEWFKEKLKAFETAKKEMRAKQSTARVAKKDEAASVEEEELICKDFSFEDWALLQLRYELHLLSWAFKKEVNDPDRPAMPIKHAGFYYKKFFAPAQLSPSSYGCETIQALVNKLLADCLKVVQNELVESTLPEETDLKDFMKLVEEARKDRIRRVDAGDESANLKFSRSGKATGKGGGAGKAGKGGKGRAGAASKDKGVRNLHVGGKSANAKSKPSLKPIAPLARVPMSVSKLARNRAPSGGGRPASARLPPPPPAPVRDVAWSQNNRNTSAPHRKGNRQGEVPRGQQGNSSYFTAESRAARDTRRFEGPRNGGGAKDAPMPDRSGNTRGWGNAREQARSDNTRGGGRSSVTTRPWKVANDKSSTRTTPPSRGSGGAHFEAAKRQRYR